MGKDEVKDIACSIVKGAVSSIPGFGGVLSEFISKAEQTTLEKRRQEWMALVNARLDRMQDRIDELSSNDFYVTIAQKTTALALQAHSKQRREQFANMLANSFDGGIGITEDKQLMFIHLLDQLTPMSLMLLKHLSENHYDENKYVRGNSMCRTYTIPGTEHFLEYLAKEAPEFEDRHYIKNLILQLIQNNLVTEIDFRVPASPERNQAKHTTDLGDDFLRYIEYK